MKNNINIIIFIIVFDLKRRKIMQEYENFLKKALEMKNQFDSVNFLSISQNERSIIEKLKYEGLIKNIRYIGMFAVGFDITYDGIHYFD